MKINNQNIIAIIQARIGSTRLPGKVMKKIEGIPVIEHIINRLKNSRYLDDIVIATSDNTKDKVITELAKKKTWKWFAGSETDVLGRFVTAAHMFNADVIVRVCADCIFYDPLILDNVLLLFLQGEYDYATTTIKRTYPRGIAVEILTRNTLENIALQATLQPHREHITSYIVDHQEQFKILNYMDNSGRYNPNWRWVIDTHEDFEFASFVYSRLYNHSSVFGAEEIHKLMVQNPDRIIFHI